MVSRITRGKVRKPLAMILYGPPGLGKSSFASGFPNVVFIGPEENDELDAARFPIAKSYTQFMSQLDELATGKHQKEGFKYIAIDTIDALEKLIHKEIVDSEPGKTMATARQGFGKSYIEANKKLWQVREKLEVLRDKCGFGIIVLGHSIKGKFSDPMLGIEYDTYEMCLHKGKKVDANSFFTEWASTVLFINDLDWKDEDGRFAVSSGVRQLLTTNQPSHLAKNRFNLPKHIDLVDTSIDGDHSKNVKILMDYVDAFYVSGAKVNTAESDLIGIQNQIKQMIGDLKDQTKLDAIRSVYIQNENNLNGLIPVRDRLAEIIQNQ